MKIWDSVYIFLFFWTRFEKWNEILRCFLCNPKKVFWPHLGCMQHPKTGRSTQHMRLPVLVGMYFLMYVFLTPPALAGGPEPDSMCSQLTLWVPWHLRRWPAEGALKHISPTPCSPRSCKCSQALWSMPTDLGVPPRCKATLALF